MRAYRFLVLAFLLPSTASSQASATETVAELRKAGGSQVAAAEMKGLLTGATVESTSGRGRKREFENTAGGTLYAVSADASGALTRSARVSGDWNVKDDGAYCVKVPWRGEPEEWCRFLFRLGDAFYLAEKTEESAKLRSVGIKK